MTQHPAQRAPRYTSYPPATHFGEDVGPDAVAGWLGRIPAGPRVSLYVHIPFCRRLCWFCACRTQGTLTEAPLAPYLEMLDREMALVARHLPAGVCVDRVHLGGGTPTLLSPALMARFFDMLGARLPRAPGAGLSVEVDPTEIDAARLDALAGAGLTRASLGVQDFDPDVQAAIGRRQSVAQTRRTIEGLRARGVDCITLDLLYGLPGQTSKTLDRTLDHVAELAPERVALHGYAHVPRASRRQVMIREADLPDTDQRRAMSDRAAARLRLAGYRAIGLDHFVTPGDAMARAAEAGTLRRDFQGYTADPLHTLIGIGASAISRLPGGYAQNAPRTGDWTARLKDGRLPTARGHALSDDDRLRGAVIERLLCDFAVDPARFDRPDAVAAMTAGIALTWPDEVTRDATGTLRVAAAARHKTRHIAMTLDRYAGADDRHSLAI